MQTQERGAQLPGDAPADVSIAVVEGVQRGHGVGAYVGYVVRMEQPLKMTVERRYSEFAALREVLLWNWPGVLIASLPPKHTSGSNSHRVVQERVKQLSLFLKVCANVDFLFLSDEFQLFLTSTADLRKHYQRLDRPSYALRLQRYRQLFPDIPVQLDTRSSQLVHLRGVMDPFLQELAAARLPLAAAAVELQKLATRHDEYVRELRILYNQTLPDLQGHINLTTADCQLLFTTNQPLRQQAEEFGIERPPVYWLLLEAVRLEMGESSAAEETLEGREELERAEERMRRKMVANEEEMRDIRNKKLSLRQVFSRNGEELARQLQGQNGVLQGELEAIRALSCIVNHLIAHRLIPHFRQQRHTLWRRVWAQLTAEEMDFAVFQIQFYRTVLRS